MAAVLYISQNENYSNTFFNIGRIPLKVRMVTAALVMIAMFILTVALVKINTDSCKCYS